MVVSALPAQAVVENACTIQIDRQGLPETQSMAKMSVHDQKMMLEIKAVKRLVAEEYVQFRTLANGNWTDPTIWEGGIAPTEDSNIAICHKVTIDGVIPDAFISIRVDGTLAFATDRNTELKVDTIVIGQSGKFEMGTLAAPIAENVQARLLIEDRNHTFNTTDDTQADYDPKKLGQGLISLGSVTMHGTKKTGATTLNGVRQGVGVLQLDSLPTDWKVGDVIVLAGTTTDAKEDEKRTITALDYQSHQLTLDQSLAFDHLTPAHDKKDLTLKVHIINLTRNATIESVSENNEHQRVIVYRVKIKTRRGMRWQKKYTYDTRGHVMFMHNNKVNIQYAGFNYLGRTNKLADIDAKFNVPARYSVHFHQAGDAKQPAIVHGNAVQDSMGWGYVNHSSSVDMTHNVAYNVRGAAFVAEAGNETGSMIGNVSIRNHGRYLKKLVKSHSSQLGSLGNGFWIHSKRLTFRDNVSAGAKHTAFHLWGIMKSGATAQDQVNKKYAYDPEQVAEDQKTVQVNGRLVTSNNLAYGTRFALQFNWFSGSFNDHFTAYNVKIGIARVYSHGHTFKDLTLINDTLNPQGTGVMPQTNASSYLYFNSHIEGFETGLAFEGRAGSSGLRDGYFNNVNNIQLNAMYKRARHVLIAGNVRFGKLSTAALNGRIQLDFSRNINGNTPRHRYFLQLDSMDKPHQFKMTRWGDDKVLEEIKQSFGFASRTRPEPIERLILTFQPDMRRGVHLPNLEVSGTGSKLIDLSNAFLYVQPEQMNPVSFSVVRNTNPNAVTATIEGKFLRLDHYGESADKAIIEVQATLKYNSKHIKNSAKDAFLVSFK
jgi:hypothetical protein